MVQVWWRCAQLCRPHSTAACGRRPPRPMHARMPLLAAPAEATAAGGEELHPGRTIPAAQHAAAASGLPQAPSTQQLSNAHSVFPQAAAAASAASLAAAHAAAASRPQRERDSPEVCLCVPPQSLALQ